MKILVNFKSGLKQIFIVPKYMLALEFRNMAKEIGGNIESIEFSLSQKSQHSIAKAETHKSIFKLPDLQ